MGTRLLSTIFRSTRRCLVANARTLARLSLGRFTARAWTSRFWGCGSAVSTPERSGPARMFEVPPIDLGTTGAGASAMSAPSSAGSMLSRAQVQQFEQRASRTPAHLRTDAIVQQSCGIAITSMVPM